MPVSYCVVNDTLQVAGVHKYKYIYPSVVTLDNTPCYSYLGLRTTFNMHMTSKLVLIKNHPHLLKTNKNSSKIKLVTVIFNNLNSPRCLALEFSELKGSDLSTQYCLTYDFQVHMEIPSFTAKSPVLHDRLLDIGSNDNENSYITGSSLHFCTCNWCTITILSQTQVSLHTKTTRLEMIMDRWRD